MSLRAAWNSLWFVLIQNWSLRTAPADRWMVWGVPIFVIAALALASKTALEVGWTLFPYAAAVGATALISNRVCVRSGLISATLATFGYNYLFAGIPISTAPLNYPIMPVLDFKFHVPGVAEIVACITMYVVAVFIAPRRNRTPNPRVFDSGQNLPFTRQGNGPNDVSRSLHGHGLLFWDPPSVKSYEEGCDVGTAYGHVFLARAQNGEPRPCISWIVHDMVIRGPELYGGVEIGFLQTIASASRKAIVDRRSNDQ